MRRGWGAYLTVLGLTCKQRLPLLLSLLLLSLLLLLYVFPSGSHALPGILHSLGLLCFSQALHATVPHPDAEGPLAAARLSGCRFLTALLCFLA